MEGINKGKMLALGFMLGKALRLGHPQKFRSKLGSRLTTRPLRGECPPLSPYITPQLLTLVKNPSFNFSIEGCKFQAL
jgi:hypothetical protein